MDTQALLIEINAFNCLVAAEQFDENAIDRIPAGTVDATGRGIGGRFRTSGRSNQEIDDIVSDYLDWNGIDQQTQAVVDDVVGGLDRTQQKGIKDTVMELAYGAWEFLKSQLDGDGAIAAGLEIGKRMIDAISENTKDIRNTLQNYYNSTKEFLAEKIDPDLALEVAAGLLLAYIPISGSYSLLSAVGFSRPILDKFLLAFLKGDSLNLRLRWGVFSLFFGQRALELYGNHLRNLNHPAINHVLKKFKEIFPNSSPRSEERVNTIIDQYDLEGLTQLETSLAVDDKEVLALAGIDTERLRNLDNILNSLNLSTSDKRVRSDLNIDIYTKMTKLKDAIIKINSPVNIIDGERYNANTILKDIESASKRLHQSIKKYEKFAQNVVGVESKPTITNEEVWGEKASQIEVSLRRFGIDYTAATQKAQQEIQETQNLNSLRLQLAEAYAEKTAAKLNKNMMAGLPLVDAPRWFWSLEEKITRLKARIADAEGKGYSFKKRVEEMSDLLEDYSIIDMFDPLSRTKQQIAWRKDVITADLKYGEQVLKMREGGDLNYENLFNALQKSEKRGNFKVVIEPEQEEEGDQARLNFALESAQRLQSITGIKLNTTLGITRDRAFAWGKNFVNIGRGSTEIPGRNYGTFKLSDTRSNVDEITFHEIGHTIEVRVDSSYKSEIFVRDRADETPDSEKEPLASYFQREANDNIEFVLDRFYTQYMGKLYYENNRSMHPTAHNTEVVSIGVESLANKYTAEQMAIGDRESMLYAIAQLEKT